MKTKQFVYFMETTDGNLVKIGCSRTPERRLFQVRMERPELAIRLIGWIPGTFALEHWLHVKFIADREGGEWYRDSPALRQFIAALGLIAPKEQPPALPGTKICRQGFSRNPRSALEPKCADCLRAVRWGERYWDLGDYARTNGRVRCWNCGVARIAKLSQEPEICCPS